MERMKKSLNAAGRELVGRVEEEGKELVGVGRPNVAKAGGESEH